MSDYDVIIIGTGSGGGTLSKRWFHVPESYNQWRVQNMSAPAGVDPLVRLS